MPDLIKPPRPSATPPCQGGEIQSAATATSPFQIPSFSRRGRQSAATAGEVFRTLVIDVSIILATAILAGLPFPPSADAFYEWQDGQSSGELRGLFRAGGGLHNNPNNSILYENDTDSTADGTIRLIADGYFSDGAAVELNAYQYFQHTSYDQTLFSTFLADVERSSSIEWEIVDGAHDTSRLAIDRVNLRVTFDRTDFTIGRQAVNLATTFYFTPNDFFAPFSAQTFYRVYKSGVDAARAEVRLGELSQLTLLGVLGYKRDSSGANGWSKYPDSQRNSFVARASAVIGELEWSVLGGKVRRSSVIGGSVQGEIGGWLGVRSEGHYANPEKGDSHAEITVGLEHRFENSLDIRVEHFHHGSGYGNTDDYSQAFLSSETIAYLGRNYTALGAGYEFTPLLSGQALLERNWTDASTLLAFYSVYSLSDESELSLTLSLPFGDEPAGMDVKSEFGAYPRSVSVELRIYF